MLPCWGRGDLVALGTRWPLWQWDGVPTVPPSASSPAHMGLGEAQEEGGVPRKQ